MTKVKSIVSILTCVSASMLMLSGPVTQGAAGQMALGPQGSWGNESDLGVGGRVLLNISDTNLETVGSVDVFFPDGDVDWLDINANIFYHFHLADSPSVVPYAGGGLNLARLSNGGSNTEAGLNLGGGLRFPGASVTPFVELRAVVSDADQLVITGGFLFGPTQFR